MPNYQTEEAQCDRTQPTQPSRYQAELRKEVLAPIDEEMAQLDKTTMELISMLETLENRLGPVLSSGGVGEKREEMPEPMLPPLANAIRDERKQVGRATFYVREILSRLAL